MAPGPAPERLTTATQIKHHIMHVDVHPSMHKPALSHMERTYLQPTHENACPPEALGLPHSVPTVRIPAARLSAFAVTSQKAMRALGTALALSRERPRHVFPTCLPHPDAEAPSSVERRAERRASRRPHRFYRECSRQRPCASAHGSALGRRRVREAACPTRRARHTAPRQTQPIICSRCHLLRIA